MQSPAITERTVLDVNSTAFSHKEYIPEMYSCEGDDVNPMVIVRDIPKEAKSLALIIDDPDAPGKTFDHWVVWNIPPNEIIEENSIPGKVGKNSKGENRYTGPCPPSGTHRYFFKVYALDTLLELDDGSGKATVEQALENHILAYGELIGLYRRRNSE